MIKYHILCKKIVCAYLLIWPLVIFAQQQTKPIISPEILEDNSVIFRLIAPGADTVKLAGTINADYSEFTMVKKDSGIFEIKIGPLAPDMYVYFFKVDGIPTLDPNNKIVVRDGSHIENRLIVPGHFTDLYDVKDVPHGQVTSFWYPANIFNTIRRCLIYTPPGYLNSADSYPVLYLLHGGGGDEEGWISRGRVNYILDNLIEQGKVKPMVVVMPNGVATSMAAPGESAFSLTINKTGTPQIRDMVGEQIAKSLIKDLIPFIESSFRVKKDAGNRALAGLSMGGYQTQIISNLYPEEFDYIGVMSMGMYNRFDNNYVQAKHVKQLLALQESHPKLYWIACGKEDFLFEGVLKLLSFYDDHKIDYIYRESEGGHSWNNWRLYVTEFVQMLF